jgi:hypothetical protein
MSHAMAGREREEDGRERGGAPSAASSGEPSAPLFDGEFRREEGREGGGSCRGPPPVPDGSAAEASARLRPGGGPRLRGEEGTANRAIVVIIAAAVAASPPLDASADRYTELHDTRARHAAKAPYKKELEADCQGAAPAAAGSAATAERGGCGRQAPAVPPRT